MPEDRPADSPQDRPKTDTQFIDLETQKREFGKAVQRERERENLAQSDLASLWMFSRTTIANMETQGQVSARIYELARERYAQLPTIAKLEKAAKSEDDVQDTTGGTEFEEMLISRTRNRNSLLGEWNALWQTEVEGKELFNSESLIFSRLIRHRLMITNPRPSAENPVGGYSWRAECRFFDTGSLLGVYMSTSDINNSCGALQLKVHISGQYIDGQWIGEGYDRILSRGHVVFCRDRQRLVPRMEQLLGQSIDFQFKA